MATVVALLLLLSQGPTDRLCSVCHILLQAGKCAMGVGGVSGKGLPAESQYGRKHQVETREVGERSTLSRE